MSFLPLFWQKYELKAGDRITFAEYFNEPLTDIHYKLMERVERADFGLKFNQQIDFSKIPSCITTMGFGEEFDQPLDNLPKTVILVILYETYPHKYPGHCTKIIRTIDKKGG